MKIEITDAIFRSMNSIYSREKVFFRNDVSYEMDFLFLE
jgi:hypothetical protein